MNVLIKHTWASLTINENADPDFESYFNCAVSEDKSYCRHHDEGTDDILASE